MSLDGPAAAAGPAAVSEVHVYALIAGLTLMSVFLFWVGRKPVSATAGTTDSASLTSFRRTFLTVWSFAIIADWLQGPYVYALYSSYGFTNQENALLFICGFAASGFSGPFIGQFADLHGRKKTAVAYCVLVILSCATKHFKNYHILMLGRVLGGMATSVVFSVFEAWMVAEHNCRHKFSAHALDLTFGHQQFLSSCMAITAGLFAQAAANMLPLTHVTGEMYFGGYCSPFDLAMIASAVGMGLICFSFGENYGKVTAEEAEAGMIAGIHRASMYLKQRNIWGLGLSSALFESSMYLWVFIWTPALTIPGQKEPPYGLIFTSFMVACMLGSQIFSLLSSHIETSAVLIVALGTAGVANMAMSHALQHQQTFLLLAEFVIFEVTVGMYFPTMGALKARYVPESSRATIYNIFRVPLNLIVVASLYLKPDPADTLFLTTGLLLTATVLAVSLYTMGGAKMISSGRRYGEEQPLQPNNV